MKYRSKLMTVWVQPELYHALCVFADLPGGGGSPSVVLVNMAMIGLDTLAMAEQREAMLEERRRAERRHVPKEGEFDGP